MIKIALGVYGTLEITIGKAHRVMSDGGKKDDRRTATIMRSGDCNAELLRKS
jgi:hypothetical protein